MQHEMSKGHAYHRFAGIKSLLRIMNIGYKYYILYFSSSEHCDCKKLNWFHSDVIISKKLLCDLIYHVISWHFVGRTLHSKFFRRINLQFRIINNNKKWLKASWCYNSRKILELKMISQTRFIQKYGLSFE